MPTHSTQSRQGKGRSLWVRIPVSVFLLGLAVSALWLGMSIPSYFRSVSPLVLEAAAEGTESLDKQALDHLQTGRPGLAEPLMQVFLSANRKAEASSWQADMEQLLEMHPAYRWSGGPAPFYEEFLKQADFLNPKESAVVPTLLPAQHRKSLLGFLEQSPNQKVHQILKTRTLGGWKRFYPVYSTSGHPLEATILTAALLEQSASLSNEVRDGMVEAAQLAVEGRTGAVDALESYYIGILAIGRHADWLQLKTLMLSFETREQLLFAAQAVQEDSANLPVLMAAYLNTDSPEAVNQYLRQHGERGREGIVTALGMGQGAVESLLEFNKPLYQPPGFWRSLPPIITSGQDKLKDFAELFPLVALTCRVMAFGLCGFFLVGIARTLILGRYPPPANERRFLINLDSMVGAILVTLLVWVLIEPGLLDFRPNEEGRLEINLAQVGPSDPLQTTETALETMIDQVTILVLLLFFILQLLVFIFGLIKIFEIRRQTVSPEKKLHLIDNEENLFDLGLYVGLGGTVLSLILVVLNIVDASLMAAYASTLFGIIFVAILKVGFVRPSKRKLILESQ